MVAEELAGQREALAAEGAGERMGGLVNRDGDGLVDICVMMGVAARAKEIAEFRPVFLGGPEGFGEGDDGAVNAHESAAAGDELHEILPVMRLGEGGAEGVVEEDGVELLQGIPFEYGGVIGDGGFKRTSPFTHEGEGLAGCGDGGRVSLVFLIAGEDQEAAGFGRGNGRLRRDGLLNAVARIGAEDGKILGVDGWCGEDC